MLTYTQVKECIEEIGRDGLEKLIEQYNEEMIEAAFECDIQPYGIEEAYTGQYRDDEDFAESFAYDLGSIDKNVTWPYTCINWEQAAKELMYDYSEHNGYYFRNC